MHGSLNNTVPHAVLRTVHITVSALYFSYILFQECCMSLGSCMLCYVMSLCHYGLIVFHFEYMPRLTKDQRIWICLEHARFQNAAEVRRRWPGRWGNTPATTLWSPTSLHSC